MTVVSAVGWWTKVPDDQKCRVCEGFGSLWYYASDGWRDYKCTTCAGSGEQPTPEVEALRHELKALIVSAHDGPSQRAREQEIIAELEARNANW